MANKRIRTTVYGTTAPLDKNVAWIDTTDASSPVLKLYVNGEWTASGGSGPEPEPQVQADWSETDEDAASFIQNKPYICLDIHFPLESFAGKTKKQAKLEFDLTTSQFDALVRGDVIFARESGYVYLCLCRDTNSVTFYDVLNQTSVGLLSSQDGSSWMYTKS